MTVAQNWHDENLAQYFQDTKPRAVMVTENLDHSYSFTQLGM